MKKSIVAGAASIVLAAMPVVSTFAASDVVDQINVTVTDECSFSRTDGEGNYSTTLLADAINNSFAHSEFKATCNFGVDGKDITVTAAFTDLVSGANTIPYSGSELAAGTAGWNAAKGEKSGITSIIANNGNLINVTAANADQYATVWYSVATDDNQAAGTYTGYATYTLAEN